jgi:hypothetical protein
LKAIALEDVALSPNEIKFQRQEGSGMSKRSPRSHTTDLRAEPRDTGKNTFRQAKKRTDRCPGAGRGSLSKG